jgi:hypothetical protein
MEFKISISGVKTLPLLFIPFFRIKGISIHYDIFGLGVVLKRIPALLFEAFKILMLSISKALDESPQGDGLLFDNRT